jgi:cysteine desulfurase
VLSAMGVERQLARGALRLTLGATTTASDVARALELVPPAVEQLRQAAPSATAAVPTS